MGAPLQWNTRTRFESASIVARISCSQRVNSCSSTTSSSRTNPNAARTARASEWQCLEQPRTDHRVGIRMRRRRPGRTVRSAGKRPRCHSGRRKDVRCCAASVFSTGGRPRAPDHSLNFGKRASGMVVRRRGWLLAPSTAARVRSDLHAAITRASAAASGGFSIRNVARFYIENFGCRATQADGAALERQFLERGLERARAARDAQIVVLNTCTVTEGADKDARASIRRLQRANPDCRILVTGCYAQRAPEELAALPGVTWVVGNSHKHQAAEIAISSSFSSSFLAADSSSSSGFVPLAQLSLGRLSNDQLSGDQFSNVFFGDIFAPP